MNKINTAVVRSVNAVVAVMGIDLAKNVFAIHGVNAAGKPT